MDKREEEEQQNIKRGEKKRFIDRCIIGNRVLSTVILASLQFKLHCNFCFFFIAKVEKKL